MVHLMCNEAPRKHTSDDGGDDESEAEHLERIQSDYYCAISALVALTANNAMQAILIFA